MVNIPPPSSGLEGLIDLDRKGVDIRPTLLRVLTDQYLLSATHTPDEERHYTELAMRLIDETDIPTRAVVAAKLAPHAYAPKAIILQLARDLLAIAEPVLRYSPCLTPADCDAIVAERGPLYARIIAQRGRPDEPPVKPEPTATRSAPTPRPSPTASLQAALAALKLTVQPESEPQQEQQPALEPQPEPVEAVDIMTDAAELCEFFFTADSPERCLILINLEYVTWEPSWKLAPMQRADIWHLESSALKHNTSVVARELERALGISAPLARRIVDDNQGEPIVAAAKAMDIPADVLQRILLFMNPRIGQSVERVYELAALYDEISVETARRLIAILRAADPVVRHRETDQSARNAAGERARRAPSEATRPVPQRDTPSVQRMPANNFGR